MKLDRPRWLLDLISLFIFQNVLKYKETKIHTLEVFDDIEAGVEKTFDQSSLLSCLY